MFPRLVVAGLSGESGKTLVSLALLLDAGARGMPVRAFKKGPDYIDAAWLRWASGGPARNLDTHLMGFERAVGSFTAHALADGFNLIEGNRGLYDGLDARGTHSTAELAKRLAAPVLLVINATKVTRTAAALVLGCQHLDPEVRIAGVVLNQVSGGRHERVIREAIESVCGIPVLGVIPRSAENLLPSRHLGLVTPAEHSRQDALGRSILELARRLEFDRLFEIAAQAPEIPSCGAGASACRVRIQDVTIGYLQDSAFTFYYPENLEALSEAGARLVPISPLDAGELPGSLDALYIGGGFPETHAEALASNHRFLSALRDAAGHGLPIYAECGGLMLLARAIEWQGRRHTMAGVLPFDVEVCAKPQGHGYVELLVDRENPFFPTGVHLKGHEFHYSRIVGEGGPPSTVCSVVRGCGCGIGRDAVVVDNVWASYTHLHAAATPEWSAGLLGAARRMQPALAPA